MWQRRPVVVLDEDAGDGVAVVWMFAYAPPTPI